MDYNFQDAFISYGRPDSKDFAIKLKTHLVAAGFTVWLDLNDIPFGVDFQNQIDDGIAKAHNFLFIISPHAVNSLYCKKEIETALAYKKRIIPLMHVEEISQATWLQRHPNATATDWQTCQSQGLHSSFGNLHAAISKINWIYFRENQDRFDTSLASLQKLLTHQADYVQQHTRFLVHALDWKQNQRQPLFLLAGADKKQAEQWLRTRFKEEQPPCLPTDLHCELITESIKSASNWMVEVFLSYAPEEEALADRVRLSLLRQGITVWSKNLDIETGKLQEEAIKRGLEGADNVLCLLSHRFIANAKCHQEMGYALSLHKRLIPIQIEELNPAALPTELGDLHCINLADNLSALDYLEDESLIIKILCHDAPYYRTHKRLLTQALRWQSQGHNPSTLLRGHHLQQMQSWLELARVRSQNTPTPLQEAFVQASLDHPDSAALEVFIAYDPADSDFAYQLNDALQTQGKTTWFDQESLEADADYLIEIQRGIEKSNNFLLVASPTFLASPQGQEELRYAEQLKKRLIAVYQTAPLPRLELDLAAVQVVDFGKNKFDFQANLSDLIRRIETDRDHVQNHTKWTQRALEWQQNDQSEDFLLRGSTLVIAETWLQEADKGHKQPAVTDLQRKFIQSSVALWERLQRQEQEQQRRALQQAHRVALGAFVAGLVMTGLAAVAVLERNRAETVQEGQINALSHYSLSLTQAGDTFNGLLEGIRAGQQLRHQFNRSQAQTQSTVLTALLTPLYAAGFTQTNQFSGHENDVNSVSVSPDGQIVASASRDRTVRVWRSNGELLQVLRGHTDAVKRVSISPDQQLIASAGDDGLVILWTLAGKEILRLPHPASVNDVSFSPDSQTLVTATQNAVKLWDLTGQELKTLPHPDWVNNAAFSPDGQYLATASHRVVKLFDPSGQELMALPQEDWVNDVAFSPDGQRLAAASYKVVKIYDRSGQLRATLPHSGWVNGINFSPDSQLLATASVSQEMLLWTVNGELVQRLPLESEGVAVSFMPAGDAFVTVSRDNWVRLWTRQQGNRHTLQADHGFTRLSVNPPNTLLAAAGDRVVQIWNQRQQVIRTLPHGQTVSQVSFSPDGTQIATAADRAVLLWDLSGEQRWSVNTEFYVTGLAFNPDGKTLITTSGKAIQVWDLQGQEIQRLTLADWTKDLALDRAGQRLAVATDKAQVLVLDRQGQRLHTFSHEDDVFAAQFSPDGQLLASTSDDGTVRLWNLKTGAQVAKLEYDVAAFNDVEFSPDGQRIAAVGADNTIRLWHLNGNPIAALIAHQDKVLDIDFSADGHTLISASQDKRILLWDLTDLELPPLLQRACDRMRNYLAHNLQLEKSDRTLCQP